MRKVLLSFLIGCLGFISAHASSTIIMDEKTTANQEVDCIVPRPPMGYTIYNPDLLTLSFYVDPFLVVFLENFTTGESHYSFVGSSFVTTFHIAEEMGLWRISVATDPRSHNPEILYERYFTIDNGEIINVEPGFRDIIGR